MLKLKNSNQYTEYGKVKPGQTFVYDGFMGVIYYKFANHKSVVLCDPDSKVTVGENDDDLQVSFDYSDLVRIVNVEVSVL